MFPRKLSQQLMSTWMKQAIRQNRFYYSVCMTSHSSHCHCHITGPLSGLQFRISGGADNIQYLVYKTCIFHSEGSGKVIYQETGDRVCMSYHQTFPNNSYLLKLNKIDCYQKLFLKCQLIASCGYNESVLGCFILYKFPHAF